MSMEFRDEVVLGLECCIKSDESVYCPNECPMRKKYGNECEQGLRRDALKLIRNGGVEIKPCPFCGGDKVKTWQKTWKDGGENYNPFYEIHCLECGAGFNDIFETEEDAIERWNSRVVKRDG